MRGAIGQTAKRPPDVSGGRCRADRRGGLIGPQMRWRYAPAVVAYVVVPARRRAVHAFPHYAGGPGGSAQPKRDRDLPGAWHQKAARPRRVRRGEARHLAHVGAAPMRVGGGVAHFDATHARSTRWKRQPCAPRIRRASSPGRCDSANCVRSANISGFTGVFLAWRGRITGFRRRALRGFETRLGRARVSLGRSLGHAHTPPGRCSATESRMRRVGALRLATEVRSSGRDARSRRGRKSTSLQSQHQRHQGAQDSIRGQAAPMAGHGHSPTAFRASWIVAGIGVGKGPLSQSRTDRHATAARARSESSLRPGRRNGVSDSKASTLRGSARNKAQAPTRSASRNH